jgi:hypothetical protein
MRSFTRRYLLVATAALFVSGGCSQPGLGGSAGAEDQPTKVKVNRKYGLECRFHSEEVGDDIKVITYVSLRDSKTGEEVRYHPLDAGSLIPENGFDKNLSWSPDEEYLILPLGRFEGFAVVKAAEALQSVKEKKYADSVRVQLNTGTQLWHDFEAWEGKGTFIFKAGMSESFPRFKYDSVEKRLTALDKVSEIFEGYNGAGKMVVLQESR